MNDSKSHDNVELVYCNCLSHQILYLQAIKWRDREIYES